LLVPVNDPAHRQRLDTILSLYANDPTAWVLDARGEYSQSAGPGASAQERLSAQR
jgi:hypothetical protein